MGGGVMFTLSGPVFPPYGVAEVAGVHVDERYR
jgi:hypothetical protein